MDEHLLFLFSFLDEVEKEIADDAEKQVWIEKAINTLVTLSKDQDAGWKKIRRVKERFELMDRVEQTTEVLIGQVDKQNMTVHRWFANKACPGDYLYNLHPQIAAQVNERLGAAAPAEPEKKPSQTPSGATFTPYLVRITASVLNIRKGPGTTYAVTGQIKDRGVYTIVEQKGNWGRLKSGAGWISLSYTQKV